MFKFMFIITVKF